MEHHHHHHDHGPDCTCGCQDHHHHDHEHHHEHHHKEEKIRVSVHDVSVVGNLTLEAHLEYPEAVERLSGLLSEVSGAVTAHGGIVGHIKALVTDMSRNCMISVTDEEEASVKEYHAPKVTMEIACIVMALKQEELKHILQKHFAPWL